MRKSKTVLSSSPAQSEESAQQVSSKLGSVVRRRSFLSGLGAMGVIPIGSLLAEDDAGHEDEYNHRRLTRGDRAILRFLAAAELIETDLWQQYAELGGVDGGNPAYILALQNLDGDMPQYISDNTDDEVSHAAFLNAYLQAKGEQAVNLDVFRTLPSSRATGAKQIGRLTNLQSLNVDTSWYTRYRSKQNPDLEGNFPQAVNIVNQPAIPLNDSDTPPSLTQPVPPTSVQQRRMQAIANAAGFHFAMIEQGGSSLYTSMSLKVTSLEVLRIVVSIGGVEVNHFAVWHDKAGNAVAQPLAGVVDPTTGVTFPDLNAHPGGELYQTNLIFPEPCEFLEKGKFPLCSVIRPSSIKNAGAVAAVRALTNDQLFYGQTSQFFDTIMDLAIAADAAHRETDRD